MGNVVRFPKKDDTWLDLAKSICVEPYLQFPLTEAEKDRRYFERMEEAREEDDEEENE
jgi:hypothetical protein